MLFQFVKLVQIESYSEVIEAESFEEAWEKRDSIEYNEGESYYSVAEVRMAKNEDDLCDNVSYCEDGQPNLEEIQEVINNINSEN